MYKVGDKVRVNRLSSSRDWEVKVGDVFKVEIVDNDGDVYVRNLENQNRLLTKSEIEKVEEEVKVREFKIGDKVKVLVQCSFGSEAEKGRIYTIENVDYDDNSIGLEKLPAFYNWVYMSDVELVNQTKFTFPEMVQNLIDGEFEVGTELVVKDKDNLESTFYVGENKYGYGFTTEPGGFFTDTGASLPSSVNGTWTVKEQPIKEMSIEELQKELGHKIKIVERQSK